MAVHFDLLKEKYGDQVSLHLLVSFFVACSIVREHETDPSGWYFAFGRRW